jgi:hypothetical protein
MGVFTVASLGANLWRISSGVEDAVHRRSKPLDAESWAILVSDRRRHELGKDF